MTTECQHHNNCGGYCETPQQIQDNLCEDCLEATQMDASHWAAVADLRKALAFLDKASADPDSAENGALNDATAWVEKAARRVVASHA